MLRLNLRLVATAACLALLGQTLAHAAAGRNQDREDKLTARIEGEQNPGRKSRLQLRLARLKLAGADKAYHNRNFDEGHKLLRQYLEQIKASWATLEGAEDGARKHLGALKKLEISLREDERLLEDLSRRVPYPESETVKAIAKESSTVHNQVLEGIFPMGPPPKARGKRAPSPKSSMPPGPGAVKS